MCVQIYQRKILGVRVSNMSTQYHIYIYIYMCVCVCVCVCMFVGI